MSKQQQYCAKSHQNYFATNKNKISHTPTSMTDKHCHCMQNTSQSRHILRSTVIIISF